MENITVVHTSADEGAILQKTHTGMVYEDQASLVRCQTNRQRLGLNFQTFSYLHFAELHPLYLTALIGHLRVPGVIIQLFRAR